MPYASSIPLLACLALQGADQSTPAQRVLSGRVFDASATPVEGARVVLQACEAFDTHTRGLVSTTTKARGRFRVALRNDLDYAAWAEWRDANGVRRWSRIVENANEQARVSLHEAASPALPIRIEFVGLGLWLRHQTKDPATEIRAFVVEAGGLRKALAFDSSGIAKLAPLPGEHADVELYRGKTRVHTARIATTRAGRKKALQQWKRGRDETDAEAIAVLAELAQAERPPLDVARIVLAAPLVVPLRILDADTGRAIEGARIYHPRWSHADTPEGGSLLGRTTRDGRCDCILGIAVDKFGRDSQHQNLSMQVLADGYQFAMTGWARSRQSSHLPLLEKAAWTKAITEGRSPPVTLRLRKHKAPVLRVLDRKAEPMPGVSVLASLHGWGKIAAGSGYSFSRHQLYESDANGRIEITGGVPHNLPSMHLAAILPRSLVASHPLGSEVPGMRWLEWPPGVEDAKTLDLSKLDIVEVRLLRADKRPAAFATLELQGIRRAFTAMRKHGGLYKLRRVRCDRKGRCLVPRLADSAGIYALASTPRAFFAGELPAGPGPHDIELQDFSIVRGRVIDAAGRAAPHASVRALCIPPPNASTVQELLARVASERSATQADAHGRFALACVPAQQAHASIYAVSTIGADENGSKPLPIDEVEPDKEIVLELRGKLAPSPRQDGK